MGGAASTTTLWKPPVMEAVWWRGVWVAVQTVQSSQWWCVLGCVPLIPVLTLPMASPSGLEWDTQVTQWKCKVLPRSNKMFPSVMYLPRNRENILLFVVFTM